MRLSDISRDHLTKAQQEVLDAIEQGPRGNGRPGLGLIGPFGAWVRGPSVGNAVQALGEAIRYHTSLPENVKEVAICTVGVHYRAKFEFAAHKRLAIQAGVREDSLNRLRDGNNPGFSGLELMAWQFASEMLTQHTVSEATYRQATEAMTETGVIELVATVGYYCLISLTLNTFDIPLEDGMEDPFPED